MKTTFEILNACCLGEQKLKGGFNINEKWLSESEVQAIIDEFPIEVFDPTIPEQDKALQKWFDKLKGKTHVPKSTTEEEKL